jgi:antitoxin CptB
MPDTSENLRKRVYFRCHHTGMKENDILFGEFAERHLDALSDDDVRWLESFMQNNNDLDMYNWIMEKVAVPPDLDHPVMKLLIDFKNSR